jgi:hypothetical protein
MAVGDWTFDSNFVVTLPTDNPGDTGSTDPCLDLDTTGGSGNNQRSAWPTNGTINTVDITGLDSGQIECWIKMVTARNSASRRAGVGFYVSDSTNSSFDGYHVTLDFDSDQDHVLISKSTGGTRVSLQNNNTTTALASNTWYHLKVIWTLSGPNLTIKTAVDFGSGYVDQNGSGYVDASPLTSAGTDKVVILMNTTASLQQQFRFDDFKVYSA